MANSRRTSTVTPPEDPDAGDMSYLEAEASVSAQKRKELIAKVAQARAQADAAKERANTAQAKFEKMVALLASEKPERVDWYEHPGALPRQAILAAGKLNTVALHRVMERYRKNLAAKKTKKTGAKR